MADQVLGAGSNALVLVRLPRALVDLFPGSETEVRLAAASVAELLDVLEVRWPGIRDRLCDSSPRIRQHLNIFVDGVRANLETPLPSGATVHILTAMSGG